MLLTLLCVAQLMVILDISAVNVALPDMARDLSIARGNIGWTITSYSLIFGSLLLLGGRSSDLLGRRRVLLAGLGVFTIASLAAATAGDATSLFAARAAQGLGAALLSPAALSIIMGAFRAGGERATALAGWGAAGGAGAAVGVLLGGTLTELVGWRAIFFVNLPIGLVLAAGAIRLLAADAAKPAWRGLDVHGALLVTASLAMLVLAISQAGSAGWTSTQTLGLALASALGLAAFTALERRSARPLLRIGRLADRAVGGGVLMMLAASAVLFGAFLLISLYLQDVLGTGALQTGLAFLPMAVALALGVRAASHVIGRRGLRAPLAGGFATAAAGMLLLGGAGARGDYVGDVLPGMLIAGVGLGVVLVGVSLAVMTGASDDEAGMLSGLNTTGHEIGGSLGVAVLASVATAALGSSSAAGLAAGIGDAFLVAAAMAGAAATAALVLLPPAASFLPKFRLAPPAAIH
ncbi:MAG TPA: MFS transporter [Solirubrobacteraceae bacterium]|nr:MFS transporter [Solirubrobacteraceae bacterium]